MRPAKRKKNRCGAAVVEMAIVMPLFVCMIFAAIESARLGMVSQLITTAAREGCRVAVLDGNTNTQVNNEITAVFNTMGVTGYTTTITPADCTTRHASDTPDNTITVTLSVPYSQLSWLPSPYYFKTATISASATMSSERP
jgi:Flp pilus assembly protein TadG